MAARPEFRAVRLVHLSEVPLETREIAAERLVEEEKLRGVAALEMRLAAVQPRQDPFLLVPEAKARKVLGR